MIKQLLCHKYLKVNRLSNYEQKLRSYVYFWPMWPTRLWQFYGFGGELGVAWVDLGGLGFPLSGETLVTSDKQPPGGLSLVLKPGCHLCFDSRYPTSEGPVAPQIALARKGLGLVVHGITRDCISLSRVNAWCVGDCCTRVLH